MAFLALGQVTAVERTGSVISTFLAIGSIVVGLHNVWRHRVKKDASAGMAVCEHRRPLARYLQYT
jgi:hypothetical protein